MTKSIRDSCCWHPVLWPNPIHGFFFYQHTPQNLVHTSLPCFTSVIVFSFVYISAVHFFFFLGSNDLNVDIGSLLWIV
jgi:hypothetical protein